MRWTLLLLLAGRLASQTLTPALEDWRREIESAGVPVLLARVEHDSGTNTYSLPEGVEGRALFAEYLSQADFLRQFEQMYGVMVHHKKGKPAYLVMLNGGRAGEWAKSEEAVLAHEFGHAWIKSKNYPAPVFQSGLAGCLAIHTGDIAQHVLIRKELARRGIDQRAFWLETLDKATAKAGGMERPPEQDRCIRVMQAAELVDVRLGLEGVEWAGREAYEAMVKRVFPEVEPTVNEIVAWMKRHDMESVDEHRQTLRVVFEHLKALAYGRSRAYIL